MLKHGIHTRSLTCAEIRLILQDSIALFTELGVSEVSVMFGYGCGDELEWTTRQTRTAEVVSVLDDAIRDKNYELGENDVHLFDADRNLRIEFCHESDIHAESEDAELIERIQMRWLQLGFKGSDTDNLEPGKTKWRFWGPPGEEEESAAERAERLGGDSERLDYRRVRMRNLSISQQRTALRELCAYFAHEGVESVVAMLEGRAGYPETKTGNRDLAPDQVLPHLEHAEQDGFAFGHERLLLHVLTGQVCQAEFSRRGFVEVSSQKLGLLRAVRQCWANLGLDPL